MINYETKSQDFIHLVIYYCFYPPPPQKKTVGNEPTPLKELTKIYQLVP